MAVAQAQHQRERDLRSALKRGGMNSQSIRRRAHARNMNCCLRGEVPYDALIEMDGSTGSTQTDVVLVVAPTMRQSAARHDAKSPIYECRSSTDRAKFVIANKRSMNRDLPASTRALLRRQYAETSATPGRARRRRKELAGEVLTRESLITILNPRSGRTEPDRTRHRSHKQLNAGTHSFCT